MIVNKCNCSFHSRYRTKGGQEIKLFINISKPIRLLLVYLFAQTLEIMKSRVKLVIIITFGVLLTFYSLFRKYFFEFLSFTEKM